MTRFRTDESVDPESTTPVDRTMNHAVDDPAEANSDWADDVIVKSEVILATDQLAASQRCRLCDSADRLWVPFFSLGGGMELSPAHLETIRRIADISITYETDFSSVVCSYCMVKLEEFTVLREVWQLKRKEVHNREVPAAKPIVPAVCKKAADMTDASTQTDLPVAQSSTEVGDSDASSKDGLEPAKAQETSSTTEGDSSAMLAALEQEMELTPEADATDASPYEQDTVIIDDADTEASTFDSEVIDVEQYYGNRSKRRRTKSPTKQQLIKETLRLVKRQFRRKRQHKMR